MSLPARTPNLVLLTDHKVSKLPLPSQKLQQAAVCDSVDRLRTNLTNFKDGTIYEPTVIFLNMLYYLSAQSPELIEQPEFQLKVLQALKNLLAIYRYHVPSLNLITNFAEHLKNPNTTYALKDSYKPSVFLGLLEKQVKALGVKDSKDQTHPENLLRARALKADQDVLSNISICMDPYCLLTALDDKSNKKYHAAVMEVLLSVEDMVKATKKLTWIGFATDNLGLSVLRLQNIFNIFRMMKMPLSLDIVLIDKRYEEAALEIAGGKKPTADDLPNYIMYQITLGALKQFFDFVNTQCPDNVSVNICVSSSAKNFMRYCDQQQLTLGSCIMHCDDIWEDHASCTFHNSDGAVDDRNMLNTYLEDHAVNGKYVLLSKNDIESVVNLKAGDYATGDEAVSQLISKTFR